MRVLGSALLGMAVVTAAITAPAAAMTGREALDKARALDDGAYHWSDRVQKMSLHIFDAGGAERTREISVYTKRYPGEEEKAISFFSAPAEVKGTGFLQWSHKGKDADQWLYLPEFKRTRQIAMRLRDDSFVGTDFTYRDLEILGEILKWSEADASTKLLAEEGAGAGARVAIELRPQAAEIPYGRLVLWLDRDTMIPRQLDFTDRSGAEVKRLALDDVRTIGAIPTPHHLEMRSLQKGTRTVVELSEVKYDTGLADDLFTQRYLERGAP
jgi:hypothetical protein